MIKTLRIYFSQYVKAHRKTILWDAQPYVSIILGIALTTKERIADQILQSDVINALVNYNFMAFGFTIAAITIVFAIPNAKFIEFLFAKSAEKPNDPGAWETALFVMSWNGFVHFIALVLSLATLALSFEVQGSDTVLVWDLGTINTKIVYAPFFAIQIYALLEFLITMLSVFFFCTTYVNHARVTRSKKK